MRERDGDRRNSKRKWHSLKIAIYNDVYRAAQSDPGAEQKKAQRHLLYKLPRGLRKGGLKKELRTCSTATGFWVS
jgi:hypothetical protein